MTAQGVVYGLQQPQQTQFPLFTGRGMGGMGPFATMYTRDPRQALAYNLMSQGTSTQPVQHWTQGLARMLQAGAGALMDMRTRDEYEGRNKRYGQTMTDALLAGTDQPPPAAPTMAGGEAAATRGTGQAEQGTKGDFGRMAAFLANNPDTADMGLKLQLDQMGRKQSLAEMLAAEGRKAPQSRVIERNGMNVTQEWSPTAQGWSDIASNPVAGFRPARPDELKAYGLPPGTAAQVDQRGRLNVLAKPEKAESNAPFSGTSMDAQYQNILLTGDPSSPQYHAAYAAFGAPKTSFDPTTGGIITIQPNLSAFRRPIGQPQVAQLPQPGASTETSTPVGTPALSPALANQQASPLASTVLPELPQNLWSPSPQSLGPMASQLQAQQASFAPRSSAVAPTVVPAPGGYVTENFGGVSVTRPQDATSRKDNSDYQKAVAAAAAIHNSLSDYGTEMGKAGLVDRAKSVLGMTTPINTAYNKAALMAKGEELFNLGVLNGPDLEVIRRTLPDPSTLSGSATDDATVKNAIGQVQQLIQDRMNARAKGLNISPVNLGEYGQSVRNATPGVVQSQAGAAEGQPQRIADKAAYDRLPSGTEYIAPDGSRRVKQ